MTIRVSPRSFDQQHVVISKAELDDLVKAAKKSAMVEIEDNSSLETKDLMRIAESGGALDFLPDESEDIYSVEDLKVSYK